jgi:hypothetical protein
MKNKTGNICCFLPEVSIQVHCIASAILAWANADWATLTESKVPDWASDGAMVEWESSLYILADALADVLASGLRSSRSHPRKTGWLSGQVAM